MTSEISVHDPQVRIVQARTSDLQAMQALFRASISELCRNDYTPAQREVWLEAATDTTGWLKRINNQYFLLAVSGVDVIGMASLGDEGYVDFLYVHPTWKRQGLATLLFRAVESEAGKRGYSTLKTDASITARPFFEKMGFHVVHPNHVSRKGISLINYRMERVG